MVDVLDSSARSAGRGRDFDPVTRMTQKESQAAGASGDAAAMVLAR
ncbi:MAG: hypothetical protein JO037_15635 [Actinobacteria bacterium]|nr:hypothetical protein [Actinomycetota bacterium]